MNITINTRVKEKHFTNWCKEITQGLMGFCGKTAGCSNSRRICHCLNRLQKGCRKKWFKAWKKEVIDPLKLQSGKSFPAKELQVLVATEAKEKGTRSPHFNLVFLLQIRGHFMYKIHVAVHNSSIWIVRARKAPDNFRCVEFKMEIDQVLICTCPIKNSRDKIDENGVFKVINLRFVCLKTLPVTVLKTNFITAKNQGSLFIRSTKSVHMSSTPHSAYPMILPVYILYTNMWPELEGILPQL